MDSLTIGELARLVGSTTEAIRYYERLGIVEEAPRNSSGYRQYPVRVIDELRLLKAAQALGFSLESIGRILALTRQEPVSCRPICNLVGERIAEIDARIEELKRARNRLAAAVAACDDADACVVAEHLTSVSP